MITVLLVDDYPVMRELLREILERYSDIQVVGEAATGEEAVRQTTALHPSVVVIDVQLPTMSGEFGAHDSPYAKLMAPPPEYRRAERY